MKELTELKEIIYSIGDAWNTTGIVDRMKQKIQLIEDRLNLKNK